jgi:hypothetical protein
MKRSSLKNIILSKGRDSRNKYVIKANIAIWKSITILWRHDTQQNNTQHNDIQHKVFICDTQQK